MVRQITQNNSVFIFVRKAPNDNHGRPNLKIDMDKPSNRSEATGFLHGKNSKFTWTFGVCTTF